MYMKHGYDPYQAAQMALTPIALKYPGFGGALVAINKDGEYGKSCLNFDNQPLKFYF